MGGEGPQILLPMIYLTTIQSFLGHLQRRPTMTLECFKQYVCVPRQSHLVHVRLFSSELSLMACRMGIILPKKELREGKSSLDREDITLVNTFMAV